MAPNPVDLIANLNLADGRAPSRRPSADPDAETDAARPERRRSRQTLARPTEFTRLDA